MKAQAKITKFQKAHQALEDKGQTNRALLVKIQKLQRDQQRHQGREFKLWWVL